MSLKLIFLAISSAMSLLRLSRREDWWKDAEILGQLVTAQERLAAITAAATSISGHTAARR